LRMGDWTNYLCLRHDLCLELLNRCFLWRFGWFWVDLGFFSAIKGSGMVVLG
jgi:hypothetical protein